MNPYTDDVPHPHSMPKLAERLSRRRAIARVAYEEGAAAIIMPVRQATLKEVGKFLRERVIGSEIPEYYLVEISKNQVHMFLHCKMPTELIENLDKLKEASRE